MRGQSRPEIGNQCPRKINYHATNRKLDRKKNADLIYQVQAWNRQYMLGVVRAILTRACIEKRVDGLVLGLAAEIVIPFLERVPNS